MAPLQETQVIGSVAEITEILTEAERLARAETGDEPEPQYTQQTGWPRQCTVGPGLEGAIACDSAVGYVNGSKGWLIYRGYDIFDLCAHSTFEEVCYLLIHGELPDARQLQAFRRTLISYRSLTDSLRHLIAACHDDQAAIGPH